MTTLDIGLRGENEATEYLLKNGFEIIDRNWRNGRYELDIVARKGDMLHIVEVKTRRENNLTSPEYAMNRKKFNALCQAVTYYIKLYRIDLEIVFDLVAVEYSDSGEYTIRYIPNVMSPTW